MLTSMAEREQYRGNHAAKLILFSEIVYKRMKMLQTPTKNRSLTQIINRVNKIDESN